MGIETAEEEAAGADELILFVVVAVKGAAWSKSGAAPVPGVEGVVTGFNL